MSIKYLIFFTALSINCLSLASTIDPRNINEWQKQQTQDALNLSSWPVTRIKQLEHLKTQLISKISEHPRHCPIISDNRLGYHSSLNVSNEKNIAAVHQIDFTFTQVAMVRSIALVPAFNPLQPYGGSYAFPKNFKIVVETWQEERKEIVNWIDRDFPNPGSYPVFFNNIDQKIKRLIITAPNNANSSTHFALGEVFIWADDEAQSGQLENIAKAKSTKVNALGSYDQSSKWDLDYLTDTTTGMGFPINEKKVNQPDFLIIPSMSSQNDMLAKTIELTIDLGEPLDIARIDFWPAKSNRNIILPDFGFPESIQVKVATTPEFDDAKIIPPESKGEEFGTLFSVRIKPPKIRYIRIQIDDLQQVNNQAILGLGEIAIYNSVGKIINKGSISSKGIPAKYHNQLPRLIDGYSWGRRIIPEHDWIMGLAQRRPLDQQLNTVKNELTLAHEYWSWLLSRIITASVIFALLLLIGAVLLVQRYKRKQLLLQQGERINRDLHDEVGSSLGSITLLADELANISESSTLSDDLDDLSLMAREANASLREVVWNNDGKAILLEALLLSLFDRAERVLRNISVEKILPKHYPDIKVSLAAKRHLTMFFKEVIHNCARHAKATHIKMSATIDENILIIMIKDNGCGFDPAQENNGWGLRNLSARAQEIYGEIQINTLPDQGVSVQLKVPLNKLSKDPKHSYQTSN